MSLPIFQLKGFPVTKKYVAVKCLLKDTSVKSVKPLDLQKAVTLAIDHLIETKSNGKLTTRTKSADGFIFTALINTLKGDDKEKPTKLETKIAVTIMAVGSSLKVFTGAANGAMDGVGNDPQGAAVDLVNEVMQKFMLKALPPMMK